MIRGTARFHLVFSFTFGGVRSIRARGQGRRVIGMSGEGAKGNEKERISKMDGTLY